MTQYPHDEFDDVSPYKADEVGKHRAPGAAASSGGAGGGLKWIGLLAVLVLVIGAIAWVTTQFLGDEEQPTADSEDDQAAEETEADDAEAEEAPEENGEQNGNGEEEADDEGTGDNGEEATQEDEAEDDVDMDYSVVVYNFDGTSGVAGSVREQLDDAGFNVVSQDNWNQGWTTCGESAPVVVHPPAEEQLAEMIAEELGAATCASEGWTDSQTIAVAVGAESL